MRWLTGESHAVADSAYDLMGQRWLGFGNLSAPCWFVGLEQGGTERPEWPSVWATRYQANEVSDGRGEAGDPNHPTWFQPDARPQRTWIALIRTTLSYFGELSDDETCLRYQRENFITADGREALLELSAYAATGLGIAVPRKRYRKQGVERLHELLGEHQPEMLVCYGYSSKKDFAAICGGPFDGEGFRWSGDTLCKLTPHPYQARGASPPPQFWMDLGAEMRQRIDERGNGNE